MISLKDIKDWLKQFDIAEHYYMGKLDNKQDKSVGVYQRRTSDQPRMCIGEKSSYDIKPVSILLHWSNDADETEEKAMALWNVLRSQTNVTINNVHIPYIKLLNSEPIDVGTDEKGVYERVIEIDFYYSKEV